ncbi:hypothetical protein ACFWPJ_31200, partial [Nocardia sp. NPDC058497]
KKNDLEIAVVLKSLAWNCRFADKDVTDLITLFHIVHRHRAQLSGWRLDESSLAGTRGDAVKALQLLAERVDQGRWDTAFPPGVSPAHFSALIRRHTQPRHAVRVR